MMFKRKHKRTSRLVQRRRKILCIKLGVALFGFFLFLGGLAYTTHLEKFTIKNIHISGNSVVAVGGISDVVGDTVSGSYYLLFSRKNSFIYPKREIRANVLSAFKRIESVDVTFDDSQSITVEVKERKPFALWCGEIFNPEDPLLDSCYFLDNQGLVFAKSPDFSGSVFFKYFGEMTSSSPIGEMYLPGGEFERVVFFIDQLEQQDIIANTFSVIKDGTIEMYIEGAGKVIFNRDQDFSELFENIRSIFESETFTEENLISLDYIDLRFGNKVYYKYK